MNNQLVLPALPEESLVSDVREEKSCLAGCAASLKRQLSARVETKVDGFQT